MTLLDSLNEKKTPEPVSEKLTFPTSQEIKIYSGKYWGAIDYSSKSIDMVEEHKKLLEIETAQKFKEFYEQQYVNQYLGGERFYAVLGVFSFEQFCDHIDALIHHANAINAGKVLEIEYDGIVLTEMIEKSDTCMSISVVRDVHVFNFSPYSSTANVTSKKVSTTFDVLEGEDGKCDLNMFMTEEYSLDDLVGIMRAIVETARNNVEGYW